MFHLPKISDDLFQSFAKNFQISSTKNSDDLFYSHFLHFLCFSPSKRCRYNCTNHLFASFILKISRFSAFFSMLFHCSSSKFTTTTAQFPFYNCKLHFTTTQIVISCTLKCALYTCTCILGHVLMIRFNAIGLNSHATLAFSYRRGF